MVTFSRFGQAVTVVTVRVKRGPVRHFSILGGGIVSLRDNPSAVTVYSARVEGAANRLPALSWPLPIQRYYPQNMRCHLDNRIRKRIHIYIGIVVGMVLVWILASTIEW
jgi:hypothetical protein